MRVRKSVLLALVLAAALHVLVLAFGIHLQRLRPAQSPPPAPNETLTLLTAPPPKPVARPAPVKQAVPPAPVPAAREQPSHAPASMDAPPPPSAEEWAQAATYTLKNSKRYRYNWAQQVRSMMGTAVEGPDQGVVRFRVEIAPTGQLAKLETLWSTSAKAEQLARAAMQRMPPLPPTPTGKPLVFETTISFQPFDAGWPPIYKYDCRPDPPKFRNPFSWDGKSARGATQAAPPPAEDAPSPDCEAQLPQDSVEAIGADMERQLKYWGSDKLAPR
jgi:TonB family protein